MRALILQKEAELAVQTEQSQHDAAAKGLAELQGQAKWMEETLIEIIISEGQNEVADFKKWGVDIIPHRLLMKQGFETADDKRVEKKDRTVNEPLQFYVAKSLYQVVVLSVGKDQISGYLQTPKYQNR